MMHSRYGCGVASLSMLLAVLATGPARAQDAKPGGSLLIADFDGGKVETVNAVGGFALAPITDEQMGGTSEARMTPSKPGAQGSRGAAQMSFRVTDDFPRPFAGAWALLGPPTDLTAYKGLRFYARSKGEGKTFLAGIGQFTGGQSANYMAP